MNIYRDKAGSKFVRRGIAIATVLIMVLASSMPVFSETANKQTEEFANVVVFVQYDQLDTNDPTTNFLNYKPDSYEGAKSYMDMAKLYFLPGSTHKKSLENYMTAISYEQFHVNNYLPQYDAQTGVITPFIITETSAYGITKAVIEKLEQTGGSFSGSDLDRNGDGSVDNLTIIVQGEATDRNAAIYPHKGNYEGTETIKGKSVYTYNMINSKAAFENQKEAVIAHEFLHSVGFPDLYKYNDSAPTPVGVWDIMATTAPSMQYPLAYMSKAVKGWLTIDEIKADKKGIALVPSTEANGQQAVILKSPLSDTEFFVAEYKKKGEDINGLNYNLPGSGLILYSVNTRVDRLSNAGTQTAVQIFVKGKSEKELSNSTIREAYFSQEAGRTEFGSKDLTATTDTLRFTNGANSGIAIKNIGRAGDSISFDVEFADTTGIELWDLLGGSRVNDDAASEISLDQSSDFTPYVLQVNEDDNKAYVNVYKDKAWKQLGVAVTNANEEAWETNIYLYKDVPYVTYLNGDNILKIKKYANGTWQDVGSVAGFTQEYNAAVGSDGIYLLHSTGEGAPFTYKTKKVSESGITAVNDDVATGDWYNPEITVDGNTQYAAFRSMYGETLVKKINGSTVDTLGNSPVATGMKMTVTNGVLYFGANNDSNTADKGFAVHKYENGAWSKVGENFTQSTTPYFDLDTYNGKTYVIVNDQRSGKTKVMYEEGGAWVQKGMDVESSTVKGLSFAVSNGIIYAAYLDDVADSGYVTVKYNKTPDNTGQEPGSTEPGDPGNTDDPKKVTVSTVSGGKWDYKATTSSKIKIRWTALQGVTGYELRRASSKTGTYAKVADVLGASKYYYINSKRSAGKTYYYKIRAFKEINGKKYYGKYSNIVTTSADPKEPAIKLRAGKNKIKISWGKVTGAKVYQIYRATSLKGKYAKVKTVSYKKASFTNTKLKKGKKYYYKVRAYKTIDRKTIYGGFSKVKYVRAK